VSICSARETVAWYSGHFRGPGYWLLIIGPGRYPRPRTCCSCIWTKARPRRFCPLTSGRINREWVLRAFAQETEVRFGRDIRSAENTQAFTQALEIVHSQDPGPDLAIGVLQPAAGQARRSKVTIETFQHQRPLELFRCQSQNVHR